MLCPRKRSFLASFGLSGVLLILVFLNLNKHSVLHRVPLTGLGENAKSQESLILGSQSRDGRSLMMNRISPEDLEVQRQETAMGKQLKLGEKMEKTIDAEKEKNGVSPVEHPKPVELVPRNSEGSSLDGNKMTKGNNNTQNGPVVEGYSTTRKQSERRTYLREEVYNLHPKSKNTTKLTSGLKKPYTKDTIKKIFKLLSARMQKYFSKEQLDIDFTPGEIIPVSKIRRVLVASTWRSGSSFLGDILLSYPGTFYSFEPLHIYLKNQHLEDGDYVGKVIKFLKDISTCNFTSHLDYIEYMKEDKNSFLLSHNKIVWNTCAFNRALCFDPSFLSQMCQYLPLNVMKTVRLGLAPIEQLLRDPSLDMRVIYLIRDPRGSLHSRMKLEWCLSKACSDPQTVCDNLLTDLEMAEKYAKNYPDRFLLVRYEDLSLEPELVTREILRIAGLRFHRNIQMFLNGHTKLSKKKSKKIKQLKPYSTFRNSKTVPFAWREHFSFGELDNIQKHCRELLQRLRYTYFRTAEEYFNKSISVLT